LVPYYGPLVMKVFSIILVTIVVLNLFGMMSIVMKIFGVRSYELGETREIKEDLLRSRKKIYSLGSLKESDTEVNNCLISKGQSITEEDNNQISINHSI